MIAVNHSGLGYVGIGRAALGHPAQGYVGIWYQPQRCADYTWYAGCPNPGRLITSLVYQLVASWEVAGNRPVSTNQLVPSQNAINQLVNQAGRVWPKSRVWPNSLVPRVTVEAA